mmetsp:Transcript_16896/g.24620  ORF Transcript_16896/g.24620 Transcript_16896/m.24620 type:complete len:143 (+) Transcript_16896:2-430(+)
MHPMMSPPGYMGRPPMMMNRGGMAYSPNMPMHPNTPYNHPSAGCAPQYPAPQMPTPVQSKTPPMKTPKTPVARRDPLSAKKSKKGAKEEVGKYFGVHNGNHNKTLALAVLSFLSNEEIYNASLVSKTWCKLALDDELWQFEK